MATASPNLTITQTTYVPSQVLFNATGKTVNSVAGTDIPCKTYLLHNRDTSIYLRYHAEDDVYGPIAAGSDGGGVVPPGATIPISAVSGHIVLVRVWAESGSPICDGQVEVSR